MSLDSATIAQNSTTLNQDSLNQDSLARDSLAQDLNVHPLIAALLLHRGITNLDEARQFFNPSLADFYDPFLLIQMPQAIKRLKRALDKQERVLIYGDYDTDGVCSVSILYHFLQNHGLQALSYIPDRITEGYGTTDSGMQYAIAQGVDLLITVDCGIRSGEHVAMLRRAGIDCIICDHHLPTKVLPEAIAILNPHCPGEHYPERILCGAGVVFKLIQAMTKTYFSNYDALQHLDFVALATVADIVPLVGENRILVHHGLAKLRTNPHPALAALVQALAIAPESLNSRDLGFALGPCVNAAGRIGHAKQALELFLTPKSEDYPKHAENLKVQNEQRKLLQSKQTALVLDNLEQGANFAFSVDADWHPGIVGLIANKVVEHCLKPAIILHHNPETALCTGSARSVEDLDITACLAQCADLLERFGGHAKAAGLTIHYGKIPEFKARLQSILTELPPELREISYDLELDPQLLTLKRIKIIQRMQPFGAGNPEPVFRSSQVRLEQAPSILKDAHVKFQLPNSEIEFIGFNKLAEFQALKLSEPFDIYFSANINTFRNSERPEFVIRAFRQG